MDAPGDDLLWAATKIHQLNDALRRWLDQHPTEAEQLRRANPEGPLAVSHRTGKRRTSPGNPRRSDSIWVSDHFDVVKVAYPYDQFYSRRQRSRSGDRRPHPDGRP